MFCPNCGAEYAQGVDRCRDCDLPLVEHSQETEESTEVNLVELLRTPNIVELTVVKSLLDSMEISYVVQGEEGLHMLPIGSSSGGFVNPEGLGAVIRVREEDLIPAQEILRSSPEIVSLDDEPSELG